MKRKKKFLTIITTHFNDILGLSKTWESIKQQTNKNWYWIIIDSFTEDFYSLIPEEITKNNNIDIFQLNSSIYDAMNFGILKVNTDYYHFLNCNSQYKNPFSLDLVFNKIYLNLDTKRIFSFQLEIKSPSNVFIQKPSKYFYPFKSGHESTIFPSIIRNKILIKSELGVVADLVFMLENSFKFKLKCFNLDFVSYPKGGYSDDLKLTNEKIRGYFYLSYILILKFRLLSLILCIKRILSEIKIKIF